MTPSGRPIQTQTEAGLSQRRDPRTAPVAPPGGSPRPNRWTSSLPPGLLYERAPKGVKLPKLPGTAATARWRLGFGVKLVTGDALG